MRQPISTERLILRDITEADAELLFELDSDPEVLRYIGRGPLPDVAAYLERTRTMYLPQQEHAWQGLRLVHDRVSGEFFGWVFVRPAVLSYVAAEIGWSDPGAMEVGYRYRRAAWGRGIATEAALPLVRLAFEDPATTTLVGAADAGNAASLRVLEKLGLERVEVVRLDAHHGGPVVKMARGRGG